MTYSFRFKGGNEVYFDCFCQPCDHEGRHFEAFGYCTDCKEYLCQKCFESHRRPRPCRNHVLLDKNQMPTVAHVVSSSAPVDTCSVQCERHPEENVKFYCETHDVVVCSVCVTLEHISCKKTYVPDVQGKTKKVEETNETLCQLKKDVLAMLQLSKQNLTTIRDIHSGTLDEIKKLRLEINEMIDALEANVRAQADKLLKNDTEAMTAMENACKTFQDELTGFETRIDHLKNCKRENDSFVTAHLTSDKLQVLKAKLQSLHEAYYIHHYKFERSDEVWDFANNINMYGKICQQQSKQCDSTQMKATHVKDISVKLENDKEAPMITGCVIMPGNQIVLVDRINNKLKICDLETFEITKSFPVPEQTWEVTKTSSKTVAITETFNKNLICLNIDKNIQIERKIKTSGFCSGVAFFKNHFYITLLYPPSMEIITQDGEMLKKFTNAEQILINPQYVLAENNNFLVSDDRSNMISVFDRDGHLLAKHTSKYIRSSLDMTAYDTGTVFVCGCESNTVHVVSTKNGFKRILLSSSNGIKGPQSLAFCSKTGRLFVTQEYDHRLRVYQLKSQ